MIPNLRQLTQLCKPQPQVFVIVVAQRQSIQLDYNILTVHTVLGKINALFVMKRLQIVKISL